MTNRGRIEKALRMRARDKHLQTTETQTATWWAWGGAEEAPNPIEALMAHALQGGVEVAARVGLALAFVLAEATITGPWNQSWGDACFHLAFLERHGHVVSDAEREQLDAALAEPEVDAPGIDEQG